MYGICGNSRGPNPHPNATSFGKKRSLAEVALAGTLGKSLKHIRPNPGLMVIYHGTIRKKFALKESE